MTGAGVPLVSAPGGAGAPFRARTTGCDVGLGASPGMVKMPPTIWVMLGWPALLAGVGVAVGTPAVVGKPEAGVGGATVAVGGMAVGARVGGTRVGTGVAVG